MYRPFIECNIYIFSLTELKTFQTIYWENWLAGKMPDNCSALERWMTDRRWEWWLVSSWFSPSDWTEVMSSSSCTIAPHIRPMSRNKIRIENTRPASWSRPGLKGSPLHSTPGLRWAEPSRARKWKHCEITLLESGQASPGLGRGNQIDFSCLISTANTDWLLISHSEFWGVIRSHSESLWVTVQSLEKYLFALFVVRLELPEPLLFPVFLRHRHRLQWPARTPPTVSITTIRIKICSAQLCSTVPQSVVHSHLSRLNESRLPLVESFIVLLQKCLLCHKEPTRGFLLAPRWFFMA